MLVDALVGLGVGLAVTWVVAAVLVWRLRPEGMSVRDVVRLGPDVVRLCRRLLADSTLPPGVRRWVGFLVAYLVSPIDVIPDVLPLVGYLDDAVVVALVLRTVARRAGPGAIERHWPGSEAGLAAVRHLAGLDRV